MHIMEGIDVAGRRARRQVEIVERRRRVSELYLGHVDQHEIARQLGVNQSTISRDIAALKQRWASEAVSNLQERINRDLQELDAMEAQCAVEFENTRQMGWIAQRLAVKERRSRLVGMDAPKRSDISVGVCPIKLIDKDAWESV